jgi:hypothetical protein
MALNSGWRERPSAGSKAGRGLPPPDPDPERAVLAAALNRHEAALARFRRELPSPSNAAVRELEDAERALKAIQAERDHQRP